MPLISTRGAASAQGFGEFGNVTPSVYVEDVFSTSLWSGNESTRSIVNGIDLSTKGGLVWIKGRTQNNNHFSFDTINGVLKYLSSNSNNPLSATVAGSLTSFNTNGFSLGANTGFNGNGATYVGWAFREQAKFFDVVTYSGNNANRTIAHNLGSVPGCIMVKCLDTGYDWQVYHRGLANTQYINLNSTSAASTGATRWNSTTPTSTVFSLGTDATVNASGSTYVAYLFAHDAGGFGATGSDNVITCGSYTGNGNIAGPIITLGYEPQWLLIKNASSGANWILIDNMRGMSVNFDDAYLLPNLIDSEVVTGILSPNATGFQILDTGSPWNSNGATYIYIAIRRGPMKTPTSGTSVFTPITKTGDAPTATLSEIGFQFDAAFNSAVGGTFGGSTSYSNRLSSRLTGLAQNNTPALVTSATDAETGYGYSQWNGTLWYVSSGWTATKFLWYFFLRAPGFFDVVCYTGTGANRTVNHNLGVVPELMIVKARGVASDWVTWQSSISILNRLRLNTTQAVDVNNTQHFGGTLPTSSVFSVGSTNSDPGINYVAYLFATVAGVSKVGTYTGTGALQTINCGFASGARFVLIKRTDSTGDWWVYDSARGITSGNDPYVLLNSAAAEVTNTNYVDTTSVGFQVTAAAPIGLNAVGGTYIFLAIA